MLIKMAALGALGYAGYNYYRKNRSGFDTREMTNESTPRPAVAGGPLSERARLVHPTQTRV